MRTRVISTLIASLLVAGTALFAAEGDFKLTGSIGIGGQLVDTSDTVDEGKMREYRDLTSGLLSVFDLKGRSGKYHLDLYAENLGRTRHVHRPERRRLRVVQVQAVQRQPASTSSPPTP